MTVLVCDVSSVKKLTEFMVTTKEVSQVVDIMITMNTSAGLNPGHSQGHPRPTLPLA